MTNWRAKCRTLICHFNILLWPNTTLTPYIKASTTAFTKVIPPLHPTCVFSMWSMAKYWNVNAYNFMKTLLWIAKSLHVCCCIDSSYNIAVAELHEPKQWYFSQIFRPCTLMIIAKGLKNNSLEVKAYFVAGIFGWGIWWFCFWYLTTGQEHDTFKHTISLVVLTAWSCSNKGLQLQHFHSRDIVHHI